MPTLDDYKSQARLEMENANYEGAVRTLTEAIAIERDNVSLYFTRGLAYFMQKDYDLAIEDLTAVLVVEHQNLDALLTRAHAYFHRDALDDAFQDYSEYINIAGDKPTAPYERRAVILTRLGKIRPALDEYTKAIAQADDKNRGKHYLSRATLYYALGDFEATIADTSSAIENGFPAPDVYSARGSAHARLEQWGDALANYDKAITLDKRSASAYYNRGAVHYQIGDLAQAISDFSSSLKINVNDATTLYARAVAYFDNNELRNARRDFSKILKEQPKNSAVYHKRGQLYSLQDKFDKALADLQEAVKLAPTTPEYLLSLGVLEIELEAYENAIGFLKRALLNHDFKTGYFYHQVLGGLTLAYYLNADDAQAIEYYNTLVSQDLVYGDVNVWQSRFGWSSLLIEAVDEMIIHIEAIID